MATTYTGFRPTLADKRQWVLHKLLETRARTHADKPFLRYETDAPVSFSEVNRLVNRVAWGLAALGVKKGDRVLILLPNCLEYLYLWWGANKLGAAEVPVNNAYKGYFLEHVVNNSGAEIIVIGRSMLGRLHDSEDALSTLATVLVYDDGGDGDLPDFKRLRTLPFESVYADRDDDPGIEVHPHELAAVMYTSGTTGPSKGVMMSHAQGYFASDQGAHLVRLTESDVYYTCSPFFHVNAQMLTVYPCLIVAVTAVIYPYFSAGEWIDQIRESHATVANFLGVMMDFVCRQPARDNDADNCLRTVFSVPTPAAIVDDFKRRFDIAVTVEAYGMTEISLPIMLPYGEYKPRSSGKAVSEWFDVRIVDPDTDEELPANCVGELLVRHKEPWTLNSGYLGMPDKTAEACRNLWFHTGDALLRDEEGFFYFIDRIKDSLRRRGENISSYEVEKVVDAHPAVAESAVIAVKSQEHGGEDEVKVCIALVEDARLAPEELLEWCETRMPYFAVPRYVEFVAELPKTPNLKVQKQKLRDHGITAGTWDRVAVGFKLQEELARASRKRDSRSKRAK